MLNELQVLSSKEVQYNWNSWNSLQNTYDLHVIDNDLKYPKHLIIECWKWFISEAKEIHLDYSLYKFVDVSKWDCTYQVDFYSDKECNNRSFGFYQIFYDSRNKSE